MVREQPPFRLRPARESDADAIKDLVRRAQLNPFGLDWERFTVAVDARDEVAGCVQLKPHGDGTLELASLVVARRWRSNGVGASLIAAMKDRSGSTLWLMCQQSLITLYERFGFRVVETPSNMSPYFRQIWYLFRIATVLTFGHVRLAIMRW